MKKISWGKLLFTLVVTQAAGGVGAIFTTSKIQSWYRYLDKPFFAPPNWVFGPVWTLLYVLMGLGLYQVWNKKKKLNHHDLKWFWIQLGLNVVWSLIFFGMENPGLALIEIVFLWVAIWKMRKTVPYQLPYLLWVSFASLLNAGVWWVNR